MSQVDVVAVSPVLIVGAVVIDVAVGSHIPIVERIWLVQDETVVEQ